MKETRCTLALVVTFGLFASAQDGRIAPAMTARDNPQASAAQPTMQTARAAGSSNLPFCPAKTCLYYAGDFDSANSNANGLLNANDSGAGLEGLTWVGVKPLRTAIVAGATFNQFFTAGFVGTNPTPFQTQVGLTENGQGKIVCNTTGNATLKQYGESDFGFVQYSYTVKKLAQACTIAKPTKQYPSTYVNLAPTSNNGYGYVANVEDAKPKNHRGWKNDLDDCYWECIACSAPPPEIYSSCSSQGSGFDEFSIALTGKDKK